MVQVHPGPHRTRRSEPQCSPVLIGSEACDRRFGQHGDAHGSVSLQDRGETGLDSPRSGATSLSTTITSVCAHASPQPESVTHPLGPRTRHLMRRRRSAWTSCDGRVEGLPLALAVHACCMDDSLGSRLTSVEGVCSDRGRRDHDRLLHPDPHLARTRFVGGRSAQQDLRRELAGIRDVGESRAARRGWTPRTERRCVHVLGHVSGEAEENATVLSLIRSPQPRDGPLPLHGHVVGTVRHDLGHIA